MWLRNHDGVAILFIFYTYLLLPVLFKAHDLKGCLLTEIDMFFVDECVWEFAQFWRIYFCIVAHVHSSFFTSTYTPSE